MSKHKRFGVGDCVTVPTQGKRGIVRRAAVITKHSGSLVQVVYRSGRLAGSFGYASADSLKRGRKTRKVEYRFGRKYDVSEEDYATNL